MAGPVLAHDGKDTGTQEDRVGRHVKNLGFCNSASTPAHPAALGQLGPELFCEAGHPKKASDHQVELLLWSWRRNVPQPQAFKPFPAGWSH